MCRLPSGCLALFCGALGALDPDADAATLCMAIDGIRCLDSPARSVRPELAVHARTVAALLGLRSHSHARVARLARTVCTDLALELL